jgi:hypothetical protein
MITRLRKSYLAELQRSERGRPIKKAICDRLETVLSRELPPFWKTEEGRSIYESVVSAFENLFSKMVTGKCCGIANITPVDLWTCWASRDERGAVNAGHDKPNCRSFYAKNRKEILTRAMTVEFPPPDDSDLAILALWARPAAPYLPPLCFWSDMAAADLIAGALVQLAKAERRSAPDEIVTAEAFRQWRRRWGLKKASFALVKKWERNSDGNLILR